MAQVTFEIDNHRFVIWIKCTQDKNCVASWWCGCRRNGYCCHVRSWCCSSAFKIAARTASRAVFLDFRLHIISCHNSRIISYYQWDTYFTGTIELSCLESTQAVVFTFLVVVTGMDTYSKLETVVIYTPIPIWILFDNLNGELKSFIRGKTIYLRTNSPDNCRLDCHSRRSHQDN